MTKTPHVDRPEGWEEAEDKRIQERTASFNEAQVNRAKELGINPDNFETEDELYEAIVIREAENQNG